MFKSAKKALLESMQYFVSVYCKFILTENESEP